MGYPYTQLLGEALVSITSTATKAVNGSVGQNISISLGLPVIEQLADIATRFQIPRSAHLSVKGRPLYKLSKLGTELSLGLTFAAQGVHPGDVLVLADV